MADSAGRHAARPTVDGMIETNPQTASAAVALRPSDWSAIVVLPALIGAVGWLVADPLLGIELRTGSAGHSRPVGIAAVVAVGIIAALAGLGVRVLLRARRAANRTWTVIAVSVLAVSLLGPLGATTTAARVALLCLHLVVGAAVIVAVRRVFDRR